MKDKETFELPVIFENISHEALINVWWTGILLKKKARRFFQSVLNSDAQFNIMMILKYSDSPLTQNDLSRKLLVDKSNITGLIDRMEKMGLLRRNTVAGDRRRYHITLTPKGTKLINELEIAYEENVAKIMSKFSKDECTSLIKLTEKLRQSLLNID